ncbi:hypothetical protein FOZ63_006730, partial [Perkinsus olseni]
EGVFVVVVDQLVRLQCCGDAAAVDFVDGAMGMGEELGLRSRIPDQHGIHIRILAPDGRSGWSFWCLAGFATIGGRRPESEGLCGSGNGYSGSGDSYGRWYVGFMQAAGASLFTLLTTSPHTFFERYLLIITAEDELLGYFSNLALNDNHE